MNIRRLTRPDGAPPWWDGIASEIESLARSVFAKATGPNKYTVATLPNAAMNEGCPPIYVSDEAGGATMAFSDGTNWRRVQDRNIVS